MALFQQRLGTKIVFSRFQVEDGSMETVLAIHDMQIKEHGCAPGIRNVGLIESALARPSNMVNYGDPDIVDLAASYVFGLAMNKRPL